jgi:hypothetical protein
VVINATSVNISAYPPHAMGAGTSCFTTSTGNVTVEGLTFQSYFESVLANGGGNITIKGCNFTAPTYGQQPPIMSLTGGNIGIYGNCQYSGATAAPSIFQASWGGTMVLGFDDGVTQKPLVFNIAGNPTISTATVISSASGAFIIYTTTTSFTGGVPACAPYNVSSAGGVVFMFGNTTRIPGSLPPVIAPPGWTA